jgi:hypothetical protein
MLFDPKYDVQWGKSVGGMVWPRGYVAAAGKRTTTRQQGLQAMNFQCRCSILELQLISVTIGSSICVCYMVRACHLVIIK